MHLLANIYIVPLDGRTNLGA